MRELVFSVLCTCLAGGIVGVLGVGGHARRYIQYICALIVTLCLLRPLFAISLDGLDFSNLFSDSTEILQTVPKEYLRQFERQMDTSLTSLLKEQLSLEEGSFLVMASAEDRQGQPILSQVKVRLFSLKAAAYTGRIRAILEESCGCTIVVEEDVHI